MTRRLGRRDRSSRDARDRRLAFVRAVGDIDPRLELDALLQRVADVALAVGARSAAVAIRGENEAWRIVRAGEELPGAEDVAERIVRTGRVARGEDPPLFGLPLRGLGGALWVTLEEPLSDEEEALVSSLAGLVSAAVADATLFAPEDQAEERARRLDRTEAAFTSMVSHELRSPLAAIRGFGRLLLDRDDSITPEERREFLEAVVRQADRMASLVEDVLDAAQIEAGAFRCTFTPYEAVSLLAECVAETAAAFPEHAVNIDVSGELPPAEGDAVRLKQVLLNLLSNACRYSPEGAPVAVSAHADSSSLEFAVADRGSGIAAEDMERAFARFGRLANDVTRRARGAGLGLYIARQIVEMHGGRIWATSEPGAGTLFRFAIPLHPGAERPA